MKRVLYLLLGLLMAGNLCAQIVINPDTVYVSGKTSDYEVVAKTMVYNQGMSSLGLRWQRLQSIPTGWKSLVCDKNLCYSDMTTTEDFDLASGDSGKLWVHFKPNAYEGTGIVQVVVYDPSDSMATAQVATFSATFAHAVGMENTAKKQEPKEIQVYPNPARDYISIEKGSVNAEKIEIYNLLGIRQKVYTLKKNVTVDQLLVNDLPPGKYFIRFLDKNDRVLATKPFTRTN